MAKIADINEKISKGVTDAYQKIENKFVEIFLDDGKSLKVGKIGETVVEGYKKIEEGVVGGYKKIEEGVVDGFGKVSDKFIDTLFSKEGESVEETKKRMSGKDE